MAAPAGPPDGIPARSQAQGRPARDLRAEATEQDRATLRFEVEPGRQVRTHMGDKWVGVGGGGTGVSMQSIGGQQTGHVIASERAALDVHGVGTEEHDNRAPEPPDRQDSAGAGQPPEFTVNNHVNNHVNMSPCRDVVLQVLKNTPTGPWNPQRIGIQPELARTLESVPRETQDTNGVQLGLCIEIRYTRVAPMLGEQLARKSSRLPRLPPMDVGKE